MPTLKKMNSPVAHELAETILLLHDVRESFNTIDLWFKKYVEKEPKSKEDSIIHDSLYRDAIVQFIACFDTTAEFPLNPNQVFSGIEGGVEFFRWLKDIRDTYAAHKFGTLRQCVARVIFDPNKGVVGVGHLAQVGYAFGRNAENDILRAIRTTGRYLESKIRGLEEQLLKEAQSMPTNEILALDTAKTYQVSTNEFRMSRSKLQSLRSGKTTSTGHSPKTRKP